MFFLRIDKFLKCSRLIKRRTIAAQACDSGKVEVNNKFVKSSYKLKIGDKISIHYNEKIFNVEVLMLIESSKKEDAEKMYRIID